MKGYDEGEYRPDEKVNRGQFATLLSRTLELPEGTPSLPDVPLTSHLLGFIVQVRQAL